jgi:large subunit ribosomal protein L31
MKSGIHPTFYTDAQVTCSCGNTWTTGSTQKTIRTDVCSKCHPFYTGEQRIVDAAGQVDRFMKRLDRYGKHQATAVKRQASAQGKMEQRFMNQQLLALDLSDRVFQLLNDANIVTVGDLSKKIEADRTALLELSGFGPKSLEEAEGKLAEARELFFAEAK